jgi:hypothetical protein
MVKIKTRPPPFPPYPNFFYRVTDSTSYFQHGTIARTGASDPHSAFSYNGVGACWEYGPLYMLNVDTILSHIEGKAPIEEGEWPWFISVYENKDVAKEEVDRRKAMGRKDIKMWWIDGRDMFWERKKLKMEKEDGEVEVVEIDVLISWESHLEGIVSFISVAELVNKLGLEGRLEGRDVGGEWLALEWIPTEWVKLLADF